MNPASRYQRQQILPQVGDAGQHKLTQARLLVIGAGGLGCAALPYLVGAGVGHMTIVDPDRVEHSNLHRQTLYGETTLGRPKAEAAREVLLNLNPEIDIQAVVGRLEPDNVAALVADADLVLDCADSFAASYILSDHCQTATLPLVSASVLGLSGYVGGFCASAPSLRAVFPDLPANLASCATAGVLGPAVGLLGSLQAQLALAILLGLKPSPLGQMLSVQLETYTFGKFRFDGAPEPEVAFRFIAASAIQYNDFVVELRGEDEAPEPIYARACRAEVAAFQAQQIIPPRGSRAVLCCRSGLRAWRAAAALQTYWRGPVALLATGEFVLTGE